MRLISYKELYPNRDVFHIVEFHGMQEIAIVYYLEQDDFEQARKHIDLMEEVEPDSDEVHRVKQIYTMKEVQRRWEKDQKIKIKPEINFVSKSFNKPAFNYEITQQLFDFKFDIPEELLLKFLNLDRDKVIEDLENLLKDHFYNYTEGKDLEYHEAPFHAVFILGELEAEESLPTILKMMGQTEDYLDFTFADYFIQLGWIPIFKIAKNQLSLLEDFLKQPGKHLYFRTIITDALMQIYLHLPEKREEIKTIYQRVLTFYSQVNEEDNIIDNQFNGFLVADLMDLRLDQFLPIIKELYEKGYVHPTICGSYEDVESGINEAQKGGEDLNKRELSSLKNMYRSMVIPMDEPDHDQSEGLFYETETYEREYKKIGRNDPCPCESGKKFKKCCLGKGIYD